MSDQWKMGREAPPDTLPYSEKKQNATLGHLILRANFFAQCKDRIQPGWFVNPYNQKIWAAMVAFTRKFERAPTPHEIVESPSTMYEDPGTKNRLRAQIGENLTDSQHIGLDVLQAELTEWLHARTYYTAMKESSQLYNAQRLSEAVTKIRGAAAEIDKIRFIEDLEYNLQSWAANMESQREELGDAVSFGLTAMDKLLNPLATQGALLRGDVTRLVAPTNVGKTSVMLTIARHNIRAGKNVLLITHEGRPDRIMHQMFGAMLSDPKSGLFVPFGKLLDLYRDPMMFNVIDRMVNEVLAKRLCYLPMNRAGLTVEEVASTIRRKNDEWAARHEGEGFDLIIDDYPAKLTTQEGARGIERRHRDAITYQYFVQLALELKVHCVDAIQTNREGSRVNRGRSKESSHRLLGMEDVSEAWGPMETAPTVITVNRDEDAERRSVLTYHIVKNKLGPAGYAVLCGTRYDAPITHDDALGAVYYRGSGSYSHVAEDMLRQFSGQELPAHAIPLEKGEAESAA